MKPIAWWPALVLMASIAGCGFRPNIPANAKLTCGADKDCQEGSSCVEAPGRNVKICCPGGICDSTDGAPIDHDGAVDGEPGAPTDAQSIDQSLAPDRLGAFDGAGTPLDQESSSQGQDASGPGPDGFLPLDGTAADGPGTPDGPAGLDGPVGPNNVCSAGTHLCGATCAPDDSVNSCGDRCAACPGAANAMATCDAKVCGIACVDEFKACGAGCIPKDGCCSAIDCKSPPEGGTGTCDANDRCVYSCPASTHLCGTKCVSNSVVATCGSACSPCTDPTGGTATCDGVSCGGTCPNGSRLCAGACISTDRTCTGQCGSGTHDCGGMCASNTSVNTCGAACTPCSPPANATALCDGVGCDFTCDAPSFRRCGTGCIPVGGCCTTGDCTAIPAGGSGACNLTTHQCDYGCPGTTHLCGGVCASNTSVATCGSACAACPGAPTNAVTTCNGVMCGFTCMPNFHVCGGSCIADGQCCTAADCTGAPANAVTVCDANTCSWNCAANYEKDGSTCINMKQVPCDPNNNNPANSADVTAQVTVTYSTAGGWSTPSKCAWMCNTGLTPSADGMSCVTATPIYLFSAGAVTGNLGGRSGANNSCLAALGSLPVSAAVAFISVNSADEIRDLPTTRMVPIDRPVLSRGGMKIANNWADLLDGTIALSLKGAGVLALEDFWWSGSTAAGAISADNCGGWTDAAALNGKSGQTTVTDANWMAQNSVSCGSAGRVLLCVGFTP